MTAELIARELETVERPAGLTPLEVLFCLYFVQGKPPVIAYEMALAQSGEFDPADQLPRLAAGMMRRKNVKAYLGKLEKALEAFGVASALQIQMWLTRAIFTGIGGIDEHDPLCSKKIVRVTRHKDGSETTATTLEMVNKMEAAKTLNRMKGFDAPLKIDHNHTIGGRMVVPLAASADEWEALAMASQEELQEDAIDV